jgi:hypothetical protein
MKIFLRFRTFQKKSTINRLLLSSFLLFIALNVFSQNENLSPPALDGPVEITAHLHINKIYNINTVNETFQIDGYLEYSWFDERVKLIDDFLAGPLIYENDKANELIDAKIWFPAFELINIQGESEIPNRSLSIHQNGRVIYEERFFGTFSNPMNFRNFPFDSQNFNIQIEAFSYDNSQLIFINPDMFLDSSNDSFSEKWDILKMAPTINEQVYPEDNAEDIVFSRVVFEIDAKRKTGYYLWQVLFPLFIIIMASFTIFWIKDFGTQIGIGFTLMLTVVAFNFYSASILPKLPYQTFIEVIIIVGYIFIFLGIIAVIVNHRRSRNDDESDNNKLMKILRYVFPFTFFTALVVLFFLYRVS